jgi:hypothetical protein
MIGAGFPKISLALVYRGLPGLSIAGSCQLSGQYRQFGSIGHHERSAFRQRADYARTSALIRHA